MSEKYYIMATENPDQMLLYSMPDLPDDISDSWMSGEPFTEEPEEPITVEICTGYEQKELLPFFDDPPVVSTEFLQALIDSGIDNIVPYEVEIRSEDGTVVHRGFKAINIIGKVKAAGMSTVYTGPTRIIDASIDSLEIEPGAARSLLMFRLAENVSAIVVHERVKEVIEARGFHSIVFREPGDYLAP